MNTFFKLDTRTQIKTGANTGKYHIKLCIQFPVIKRGKKDRARPRYQTNLFATIEDYKTMWNEERKTKRTDLISIKKQLFDFKAKADGIIEKYKIRDQNTFELFFLSDHEPELVSGQFEIKIKKLLTAKPKPKLSSAEKYKTALSSFIEYSHPQLSFQEITPDWLHDYQEWYLKPFKNKKLPSITSVGINCRYLRACFNQAIKAGIIPKEIYPFGIDKYIIPEGGKEIKEFLELDEKNLFINYNPTDEETFYYYDFAVFDYYANGINFADVLSLRKNNIINNEYISLSRQKTEGSQTKTKKIIIPIHPRMQEIIKKRGIKSLDPNAYIFPVLNRSMSYQEINQTVKKFVRKTNSVLEQIRKELKIKTKITTYTLRHTFSAMILDMGASTEHLQDSLGHGNIKTTEDYKHGFRLAIKKKFSEGL